MNWRKEPGASSALGIALAFAAGAAFTWALAETLPRLWRSGTPAPVSDDIVERRARSEIDRLATQPDQVQVSVANGVVRVSGRVPEGERDRLLHSLIDVPGVLRVHNALTVFSPGAA